MNNPGYAELQSRLRPLRERLLRHPVYDSLRTADDLRVFMSLHVFAVWDFMSLVKALQRELTCTDEVWRPKGSRSARRLVNEIVLAEESDDLGGSYASHYELYREAAKQVGGSTEGVEAVVARVDAGDDVFTALRAAPAAARSFCTTTFDVVRSGSLPAVAAAFTLGREELIPSMFTRLLRDLQRQEHVEVTLLLEYLERHIELDADEHGPMAAKLLAELCGDDAARWRAAEAAATQALQARLGLWDAVVAQLPSRLETVDVFAR